MNPSLLMHLHVHASFQKKYEHNTKATRNVTIKLANLITLVDNLSHLVKKLELKKQRTEWSDYYTFTNYSNRSFTHKKEIITRFIKELNPGSLWDLGANTGQFIHIASRLGINCIAFDVDALVVELNYRLVRDQHIENILPLVMDITNPSPQIGWNNKERSSLKNRPHPDAILALALIHHLAISNNIPLYRIAKFLSKLSDNLIIEFVPKNDSQVKKMLEPRKDIFVDYDEKHFEMEFKSHYNIIAKEKIEDSERIIYQMKKKDKNENDTGNSHVY
jgi:ribosomal protein L11 methylase PrmA